MATVLAGSAPPRPARRRESTGPTVEGPAGDVIGLPRELRSDLPPVRRGGPDVIIPCDVCGRPPPATLAERLVPNDYGASERDRLVARGPRFSAGRLSRRERRRRGL